MTAGLRRAEPRDCRDLGAVFDTAFVAFREAGLKIPPVSEGLEQDIADNAVWVNEDEQGLNGGLILSMDEGCAHLILVAVHPRAGGQGIGKALIKRAVAHAREAGLAEIRLATHRDLTENVALYRHLGWEIAGEEGDKILMRREL